MRIELYRDYMKDVIGLIIASYCDSSKFISLLSLVALSVFFDHHWLSVHTHNPFSFFIFVIQNRSTSGLATFTPIRSQDKLQGVCSAEIEQWDKVNGFDP